MIKFILMTMLLQVLFSFCVTCSFGLEEKIVKMSNAVTLVPSEMVFKRNEGSFNEQNSAHSRFRSRRQATDTTSLSNDEIGEVLQIHNSLRRLEPASDMEFMIWNDYLAGMATDWSATCTWGHGQPARNRSTMPFSSLGQNLYLSTGATINITFLTLRWYSEKPYYNYNNATCQRNQMCGHYTQVVWSLSREIGCGKFLCQEAFDVETNETYKNAWIFTCNYGPAGNYNGIKPYRLGEPCQTCISGQLWCDKEKPRGLCRRDCNQNKDTCECKGTCQNQGSLDCSCRCQCTSGWGDIDCGMPCADQSTYCGTQWPKYACNDQSYGDLVRSFCFQTCGLCKVQDSSGNNLTSVAPPAICPLFTSTSQITTSLGTSSILIASAASTSTPLTSTLATSPSSTSTLLQTLSLFQSSTFVSSMLVTVPQTSVITSTFSTPITSTTTTQTPSFTSLTSLTTPTSSSSLPVISSTSTRTLNPTMPIQTPSPTSTIPTSTKTPVLSSSAQLFTPSRTTVIKVTPTSTASTYSNDLTPANNDQKLWLIIILASVAAIIVLVVTVIIILLILCRRRIKRQAEQTQRVETAAPFHSFTSLPSAPPENPFFKDPYVINKQVYPIESNAQLYQPHIYTNA